MKMTTCSFVILALTCLVAISSFAGETSVAFDFEDLQAQTAAKEDEVDKARIVLHDIFSGYCVEKLLTASVNIRDDGRPDIEIDPDTKDCKINFRIALNDDEFDAWVAAAKEKLAGVAVKVESNEDRDSNKYRDDECIWDDKIYHFDPCIKFEACVEAFTPARELNMFRFEIVSKDGTELLRFSCVASMEWPLNSSRYQEPPLPKFVPSGNGKRPEPVIFECNLGKCGFLSQIKEIKCSFGRYDDSKFPQMAERHPVVKVPLRNGVSIDMIEIKPGLYCSRLPLTVEQAFASGIIADTNGGIGEWNINRQGFQSLTHNNSAFEDDVSNAIKTLNGMPSVKDSGLVFRIPTESEWIYAAKGGSVKNATFGLLPTGEEGNLDSGWIKLQHGGGAFWKKGFMPLGMKMPNAYGLHDMVGLHNELCISEAQFGETRGKFCGRICPFETEMWKGRDSMVNFPSLRLFATKASSKE